MFSNNNEMAHTLHLRDYKQQKEYYMDATKSFLQGLPIIIFAVHFTPSSPLSPFPSPWAGCELREGRIPYYHHHHSPGATPLPHTLPSLPSLPQDPLAKCWQVMTTNLLRISCAGLAPGAGTWLEEDAVLIYVYLVSLYP